MRPKLELLRNPDCQRCDLHKEVQNVCIPTHLWIGCQKQPVKNTALVIVAKGPGVEEDANGRHFSGPSRFYIDDLYIRHFQLHELADVYLTNAVRCRLPSGRLPLGCIEACSVYFWKDISALADRYGRLVVLACGAEAAWLLLGVSLKAALRMQGARVPIPGDPRGRRLTVFITRNPAALYPSRQSGSRKSMRISIRTIREHLSRLAEFLQTGRTDTDADSILDSDDPISTGGALRLTRASRWIMALDIETFGACRDRPEQRSFSAPVAKYLAGNIAPSDMIETVAVAACPEDVEIPSRRNIHWSVYDMRRPGERVDFFRTLSHIRPGSVIMTGSNFLFDCSWLRYAYPRLKNILCPGNIVVHELAALNLLDDELRTERGLKALSSLFGTANYLGELDLSKERYGPGQRHRLLRYNLLDAISSLLLHRKLSRRIREYYGDIRLESMVHYNRLFWTCLHMHEAGIRYDGPRLKYLQKYYSDRIQRLEHIARQRGLVISGPGSDSAVRDLVHQVARKLDREDLLRLTDSGRVGAADEDIHRLLAFCGRRDSDGRLLRLLLRHRHYRKMLSTYVLPLLMDRPKKPRQAIPTGPDVTAYPLWNLAPVDDKGSSGGTIQGRLSSKKPATQVQPAVVYRTMKSRWLNGQIWKIDMSQLEYRCVAWLSGDEFLGDLFRRGMDIHAERGRQICRILGVPYGPAARQAGKQINFLIIYRGGPEKLQETVFHHFHLKISLPDARNVIEEVYRRSPGLVDWHDRLYRQVSESGRLVVRFGDYLEAGRLFLGGDAVVNANMETIVNFPVQYMAAVLVQSAQHDSLAGLDRSLLVNNRHDEGVYDVHPAEAPFLRDYLLRVYRRPSIVEHILESYPNEVPLDAELTVLYPGSESTHG